MEISEKISITFHVAKIKIRQRQFFAVSGLKTLETTQQLWQGGLAPAC
jgi:hypothetical protein